MLGGKARTRRCINCGDEWDETAANFPYGGSICHRCARQKTRGGGWSLADFPPALVRNVHDHLRPVVGESDPSFTRDEAARLCRIVREQACWHGRWLSMYLDSELIARHPRKPMERDHFSDPGTGKGVQWDIPPGDLEQDAWLAILRAAFTYQARNRATFVTYAVACAKKAMLKAVGRYSRKGIKELDFELAEASASKVDYVVRFMEGKIPYIYASDGDYTRKRRVLSAAQVREIRNAVKDENKCARTAQTEELIHIEEDTNQGDARGETKQTSSPQDDVLRHLGNALGFAWAEAIGDVESLEAADRESNLARAPGDTERPAVELLTLWEGVLGVGWKGKQADALYEYAQHVTLSPGRRCKHAAIEGIPPTEGVRRAANHARRKIKRFLRKQRRASSRVLPWWAVQTAGEKEQRNPKGAGLYRQFRFLLKSGAELPSWTPETYA